MKRAVVLAALALAAVGAPEPPRIRGVVLDPLGRPLAGATVTLEGPCCIVVPGETRRTAVTDERGAFDLEAPESPMRLRATHAGNARALADARDGAVLRLPAPRYLEGTVPAKALVFVTRGLERLAVAEANGDFRLGPLPEGEELMLHVASPRHRPYQQRVVMGEGSGNPRIELDTGLALNGRVSPPRAGVILRASQGEARESVAESDETGAFTLTGLRAGEVCVVVLDGEEEPQVLRAEAGGHLDVELPR
jgi:Carboxypeptidase regulatory-like domain